MDLDINGTTDIAMAWLTTEGLALAKNLVVFGLVIVGGIIAGRIASSAIGVGLDKSRLQPSPLFKHFATNVAKKAIFLLAFIIGLGNLGIDTGALIAGLGVSGLVLGFALKDTLSNFSAGGLILLYRPFDIGHFVEIGGTTGTVKDLTLVSTILHTPDNKVITMPNSKVWGNSIINFSASDTRRLDLVVGVAYDADIDQAMAIFMEILEGHEKVLEDPEPQVRLRELGASSVDFNVRSWVATSEYWPTHAELLRSIKYRLDEAGIGIPFPQREVWMHQMAEEPATSKEERVVEMV
ncbi:MAG: mechanosensitive ion channel family protein [Bradymonadaceae bacterium]